MAIAAAALAALACGCRSSTAPLEIGFGDDAGTCALATDLACVNYLRFSVSGDNEFTTQCVKVTEVLGSLCDVPKLADGRELFTLDPDLEVQIEVKGLRVFPATSCESGTECEPRVVFGGKTPKFRAGDFAGTSIPLVLTVHEECGAKEQYFPLRSGETCAKACSQDLLVCEFTDGCLCKAY